MKEIAVAYTTEYSALLFDVQDHVATITLNRPEAANALNEALGRDLMHAVIRCDEDPGIRAVVFTGAGRFFFAGGDLKGFADAGEHMAYAMKELTTYFHGAISRMARMDAPVIAAVNGAAAGAGMSFACACDLVLAAESARFTMAYTRAGLTPDGSSTYFLPRLVGLKRALELTLTNRSLTAQEAMEWGIVTRVTPDGEVLAEAQKLAAQLAAGPTRSFGMSKRLLTMSFSETLETQMEHETQAIAAAARTTDGREGIDAFIGKRAPAFRGE
jgi:2-(1,2-epoxy-1,2-dihydrophenyl)acetyl-CoA isomerase